MQAPIPNEAIIEATGVWQRRISAERKSDNFTGEGDAKMDMKFQAVPGLKFSRDTFCRVVLLAKDSEQSEMEVESVFRVDFSVDPEPGEDSSDFDMQISELAMKVAYPYHRSVVSSCTVQAGLPPVILPLTADNVWKDVVERTIAAEAGSE